MSERRAAPAAVGRLERILSMVPWLLANPGVELDEVASRFGTTVEEVAADLDVLGYCGVPGYGGGDLVEVALSGGRVTVRMAEFFRRPLRLRRDEALALLLAARAFAGVPGAPESPTLARASERLADALGLDDVVADVAVDAPGSELLPTLRTAIDRGRVVRLSYRGAADERDVTRHVEPWAVVAGHGAWYLRGHCREAGGERDFRLDRVRELEVTDASARPAPADLPLGPPRYGGGPDDLALVVDVEPETWWALDAVTVEEVVDLGDLRRARIPARSVEWAARFVLELGGGARVVEPPEVAARVAELASATLSRYADEHPAERPAGSSTSDHP